jgi:7-keto-8-aminopelargonate synthetase-like enzyme
MKDLDEELGRRLSLLREQGLYRELRRLDSPQSPHIEIDGEPLLNFSSNDYLGLANDPQLKQAAIKCIERFGCGSGASPLICGRLLPHDQLEQTLAAFKRAEAALCFSSGYAAALGTICALLDKDDVIVIDKLVHACIVDAARLCRAKLRVFAHNDLNELQDILSWADRRYSNASSAPVTVPSRRSQTLIVTESVFSMDGDHAALRELVALKEKFGSLADG